MAQIEAGKLQSTKKNNQVLNSLIIHFLTACTCFLLCTYPYLFSSMQYSLFSNPKFMFFVVNIIVAFLVKQSSLLDPPTNDIYDEYIKRSQRTRRVSSLHVQKKKDDNSLKRNETTGVIDEKKSIKKCCDDGEKQRLQIKANNSEVKAIRVHCRSKKLHEKEKRDEKETGLPADELKKRADAFIAKVNRRRWLETRRLVCSKA